MSKGKNKLHINPLAVGCVNEATFGCEKRHSNGVWLPLVVLKKKKKKTEIHTSGVTKQFTNTNNNNNKTGKSNSLDYF